MEMMCYQCEQTAKGVGCQIAGVCGKTPETAALQDMLLHVARGVSSYAHRLRKLGVKDSNADRFVIDVLFTTVTNVNFDEDIIENMIRKADDLSNQLKKRYEEACSKAGSAVDEVPRCPYGLPASRAELLSHAEKLRIDNRIKANGEDVTGLQELALYGLKGMASYAHHAAILGVEDDGVFAFFHETLDYLAGNPSDIADLTAKVLKVGEVNLRVMEMLDQANTGTYGHPEPTVVRVTPIKGKAILVSGHDLKYLYDLLKQTEGKGINVYTHSEMLPCLAYPELKKFEHLAGNYGGGWQDQQKEFAAFPGSIVMTTNCIQKPMKSYAANIFTCGLVAWPGVTHIESNDFTPAIEAALAAPGFEEDAPEKTITIGFAHNTVMSVAGTVVDAVKAGQIRHFFLIGGCDGAKPGRNYYTDFAKQVPDDCVILTLACGKYRFNKLEYGDIGGIPRLLDVGQCNDAYSAIQIAVALANAFECGVNDLPLSMILSWYEQKAVCILLSLLHLGIKGIRLGPTLPAFITPAVLNVLVENFGIMPIDTAEKDLAVILGN
jgi:hydroxylamine reductase